VKKARADAEPQRRGRSRFGSLGSIVFILVLTWAAALASRPLNDNSFFTHLATGRLILERGSVPSQDPYTFTAAGEPWTVQSWLASVTYAFAERLAATTGLRLLLLGFYLCAAWLLWRLSRPAASLLVRLAIMALALAVASGLWSERPYMVGVIGIAVVLLALDDELPWWILVPTMWVWGNSHGSFVFAPLLVVLVVAGGALDRGRAHWRDVPAHERRTLGAVVLGTSLLVVGPLGLRALTFPIVAARRGDVFRHVTEWKAPAFRSPSELAFLVFACAFVALAARWGRSWRTAIPAIAFIATALYAQRNIVVAAVILVAASAKTAPAVGTLNGTERPALGPPAAAVMSAVLAVVIAASALTPSDSLSDYAARPLAWLDQGPSHDRRTATDVLNGNLYEVLDGPTGTVFVDDRFDMVPTEVFEDYLRLESGGPGWSEALDRHRIEVVIWSRHQPLGSLLVASASWRVVFSDADWLVAERRR